MKYLSILFCLFLGFQSFAQEKTPDARGYIVAVGDKAPDFEMTLIDGTTQKRIED